MECGVAASGAGIPVAIFVSKTVPSSKEPVYQQLTVSPFLGKLVLSPFFNTDLAYLGGPCEQQHMGNVRQMHTTERRLPTAISSRYLVHHLCLDFFGLLFDFDSFHLLGDFLHWFRAFKPLHIENMNKKKNTHISQLESGQKNRHKCSCLEYSVKKKTNPKESL